jgi:hypothetical protein
MQRRAARNLSGDSCGAKTAATLYSHNDATIPTAFTYLAVCSNSIQMEKVTLTRQEFYSLIWSTPLSQLAKTYAISDNGLRKMCKKYNVPIPFNGYWQKLKYNKPVKPEKLRAFLTEKDAIELPVRGADNPFNTDVSHETLLVRQIKDDPKAPIVVPDEIAKPHELVKETKRYWTDAKKHKNDYSYRSAFSSLCINVEKPHQARALRFFDTLIKLLEYRGHKVIVREASTYAVIGTTELKLSLREASNRVYSTEGRWPTSELVPNGRFIFKTGQYRWEKEWRDNKTLLESMLAKIVAKLELDAKQEAEWKEASRLARIEREKEEQLRQQKEALRRAEQQKTDTLLKQSELFARAQMIRAFVCEVKRKANPGGEIPEQTQRWIAWAESKADWYDPTVDTDLPDDSL